MLKIRHITGAPLFGMHIVTVLIAQPAELTVTKIEASGENAIALGDLIVYGDHCYIIIVENTGDAVEIHVVVTDKFDPHIKR
jgi:hypothetical protein